MSCKKDTQKEQLQQLAATKEKECQMLLGKVKDADLLIAELESKKLAMEAELAVLIAQRDILEAQEAVDTKIAPK